MLYKIIDHSLLIPIKELLKLTPFKELLKKTFLDFIRNVYKTKYEKNVLISYITSPLRKLFKTHSNFLELNVILEVFKDLKFNIDVVDYTYEGEIDYSKYDLIFGFGYPFGKTFWDKKAKKVKKICYMTGAMRLFNQMERNKYLKERRGATVIPRRNYYWKYLQESISMSDAIIVTGNDWTRSTLEPFNSKVFNIRLPVFLPDKETINKVIKEKNYDRVKRNFLWFGSSGALHKGLDLCLDVFAHKKELSLRVCGPVAMEEDFFELYKKELTEFENIKYYGWVKIESNLFRDIINSCAFTIFPSCSEGGGGSLIICMAYGLIPIATIEASVDIKSTYGILLDNYNIEYISKIVTDLVNFPEHKLRDMAVNAMEYAHENHNIEVYKKDLLRSLKLLGVE